MRFIIRWVSRHWHAAADEQVRELKTENELLKSKALINGGQIEFLANAVASQEFILKRIRDGVAPAAR